MNVVKKLLGQGIQGYHPAIAHALDSVAAAIFLEHICFWQDKSEDGWAFRTQDEIQERTALGRSAQESARKLLKKHNILLEERRGVPSRLYYRVHEGNLEVALQSAETAQTRVRGSRTTECEDRADYLSKEVSKEVSNPTGGEETSRQQSMTKQLYDGLKERYGMKRPFTHDEYDVKVGMFRDVLSVEEPTPQEQERMIAWMIDTWMRKEKTPWDAIKAVRLGRDTGEAWAGPAPWEREESPTANTAYAHFNDWTGGKRH